MPTYYISSVSEWQDAIADSHQNTPSYSIYSLVNDITFDSTDLYYLNEGTSDTDFLFLSSAITKFDGNGHTITLASTAPPSDGFSGLFRLHQSSIMNITIVYPDGLSFHNSAGCFVAGALDTTTSMYNPNLSILTNVLLTNHATITTDNISILRFDDTSSISSLTISQSVFHQTTTLSAKNTGVWALIVDNISIDRCIMKFPNLYMSTSTTDLYGIWFKTMTGDTFSMTNCYTVIESSANDVSSYTSYGLIGSTLSVGTATIDNCYSVFGSYSATTSTGGLPFIASGNTGNSIEFTNYYTNFSAISSYLFNFSETDNTITTSNTNSSETGWNNESLGNAYTTKSNKPNLLTCFVSNPFLPTSSYTSYENIDSILFRSSASLSTSPLSGATLLSTYAYQKYINVTESLPTLQLTLSNNTTIFLVKQDSSTLTSATTSYSLNAIAASNSVFSKVIILLRETQTTFLTQYVVSIQRVSSVLTGITSTPFSLLSSSFQSTTFSYPNVYMDITSTYDHPTFTLTYDTTYTTLFSVQQASSPLTANQNGSYTLNTVQSGSSSILEIVIQHTNSQLSSTYTFTLQRIRYLSALTFTPSLTNYTFASSTSTYQDIYIQNTSSYDTIGLNWTFGTSGTTIGSQDILQDSNVLTKSSSTSVTLNSISVNSSSTVTIAVTHNASGFNLTYTFSFIRIPYLLQSISSSPSNLFSTFQSSTVSYSKYIDSSSTYTNLSFQFTPTNSCTVTYVKQGSTLNSSTTITANNSSVYSLTTIPAGSSSTVYVQVTHTSSQLTAMYSFQLQRVNNRLTGLSTSPFNLRETFNAYTESYTCYLAFDSVMPTLSFTYTSPRTIALYDTSTNTVLQSSGNSYTFNNILSNVGDTYQCTLCVTEQNLSTSYSIVFTKKDTRLSLLGLLTASNLSSYIRSFEETFQSSTQQYTLYLDNDDTLPILSCTPSDPSFTSLVVQQNNGSAKTPTILNTSYRYTLSTISLNTTSTMTITLYHDTCSSIYSISIKRVNTNLQSLLTLDYGYFLNPFDPNTYSNTFIIFHSQATFPTLQGTKIDSDSIITWNQNNNTAIANQFTLSSYQTVTITSSSHGFTKTYVITVIRTSVINTSTTTNMQYYASSLSITAESDKYLLDTLSASFDSSIRYSNTTGYCYGYNTGYAGVLGRFSISALSTTNTSVTDFSDTPVSITLLLPNANPSKTIQVYKVDASTYQKISPQPANFPVSLVYNSNTGRWEGNLTSLSTFIAVDSSPPVGSAGGDPHLLNIRQEKILIPNSWNNFLYYEWEHDVRIVIECSFLEHSFYERLHKYDATERRFRSVIQWKDRYLWRYTYMTKMIVSCSDQTLGIIDLLNGDIQWTNNEHVVLDQSSTMSHWWSSENGLYSISQQIYYPKSEFFKAYTLYCRNGDYITITIDRYWDEINYLQSFIQPKDTFTGYQGELFFHSDKHANLA